MITDGIDTHSRQTTEQVAAIASRIDVPVYIIAVMSPIDDPRTDETPSFDATGLQQLARSTGGEMFIASAPAHASVAARQIVAELRHQYVLAFEASSAAGLARHLGPVHATRNTRSAHGPATRPAAAAGPRPGNGPGVSIESSAALQAPSCGAL